MSLCSKIKAYQVATPFVKEMLVRLENGLNPMTLIGLCFEHSSVTQDLHEDWLNTFRRHEKKDFDFPYFLVFLEEFYESSTHKMLIREGLMLALCLYLDKDFQNFDFYTQPFYKQAIGKLDNHCCLAPAEEDFHSIHESVVNTLIPPFSSQENLQEGVFCLNRETEIKKVFSYLSKQDSSNVVLTAEKGEGLTHFVKHLSYLMSMGFCPPELQFCGVFELQLSSSFEHNEHKIHAVAQLIKKHSKSVIFIDNFNLQFYKNHANGKTYLSDALVRIFSIPNIRVILGMEKKCYDNTLANNPDYQSVHLANLDHITQEQILLRKIGVDNCFAISKCVMTEIGFNQFLKYFESDTLKQKIQKYDLMLSYHNAKECKTAQQFFEAVQDCNGDFEAIRKVAQEFQNISRLDVKVLTIGDVEEFVEFFNFARNDCNFKISGNELKEKISQKVFGQDAAIDAVIDVYEMANHEIVAPNRPRGILLLAGPTGCGKTSLAENFAELTGRHLIRLNMTEYNDEIASNKLIGAAPGYVGYETDTPLASQLQKNPNAVILIDELEKAHPTVCNTFLQIFDKGEFITGDGKKIDVTQSYIFMTSNVGSEMISGRNMKMGFVDVNNSNLDMVGELKKHFKPEFINRIDRIQTLQKISKEAALSILKKNFEEKNKNAGLIVSDDVLEHLRLHFFNDDFGGRSLIRALEQHIFLPAIKSGAKSVELVDGKIAFSNKKIKRKKKKA